MVVALFVVIVGLVDFLGERRVRSLKAVYVHAIGNAVALLLAIVNAFVHTRDAYTSVVPLGLTLSVLTVLIMAVTAWMGGELVYRHGVGVTAEDGQ